MNYACSSGRARVSYFLCFLSQRCSSLFVCHETKAPKHAEGKAGSGGRPSRSRIFPPPTWALLVARH